jgi:phosphoribosylformylglycinamidine synthase subunit PurS
MTVKIYVMPRPNVRHPESEAIMKALGRLSYPFAGFIKGRYYEFEIEGRDKGEILPAMERLADKVLANPNVETFRVEVV